MDKETRKAMRSYLKAGVQVYFENACDQMRLTDEHAPLLPQMHTLSNDVFHQGCYAPGYEQSMMDDLSDSADKECPDCGLSLDQDQKVCPCCGFQFSFR